MLKQVAYVCYKDPDTGIKYPAFCVEPDKEGIGTGAGDSYDVTLSALSNPILWRMLYKGYVGSSYTSWGLECDDDLQTVQHLLQNMKFHIVLVMETM